MTHPPTGDLASTDIDDLKRRVCDEVDRLADRLIGEPPDPRPPGAELPRKCSPTTSSPVCSTTWGTHPRHAYGVDTAFEARR
ncbi:MAG: hypothetical protein R2713_17680 [Ilumatobacteraceae bacterium]